MLGRPPDGVHYERSSFPLGGAPTSSLTAQVLGNSNSDHLISPHSRLADQFYNSGLHLPLTRGFHHGVGLVACDEPAGESSLMADLVANTERETEADGVADLVANTEMETFTDGLADFVANTERDTETDGVADLVAISEKHTAAECTARELNPEARPFEVRNPARVFRGKSIPDLAKDWELVRDAWDGISAVTEMECRAWGTVNTAAPTTPTTGQAVTPCDDDPLPFTAPGAAAAVGFRIPAKPRAKVSQLADRLVILPSGTFNDKKLPEPNVSLLLRENFTPDYFHSLHNCVAAPGIRSDGSTYPATTPNYLGARNSLKHTGLNIDRWRHHLKCYESPEILQLIQFGFPLGLTDIPELTSCGRNHGSAYQYFRHVDKFISDEIILGGLSGPYPLAPWGDAIISPLMTAPKKPDSRRVVFDATYGDYFLNNMTPSGIYLEQPCSLGHVIILIFQNKIMALVFFYLLVHINKGKFQNKNNFDPYLHFFCLFPAPILSFRASADDRDIFIVGHPLTMGALSFFWKFNSDQFKLQNHF